MKKIRALLMAGVVAIFMLVPIGVAGACPDPDNPCDPTGEEVIQRAICYVTHKC